MKILQLAPLFGPLTPDMAYGSVERVIMNLDREYKRLGHETFLVALDGSRISGSLVSAGTNYEEQTQAAIEFAISNNVDVIHTHRSDFLLSPSLQKNLSRLKCPILATFHGPANTKAQFYADFKKVPNLYFNALSFSQAFGLSKVFDITTVIYNGVDPNIYTFQDKKADFLFSFGRITKDKGQDIAVKAAKEMGIKLVIGGVILNDEDKRYFDEEISPSIDNEQIKYIGPQNDPQKLYYLQNASAVIMPVQWDDPCPLVAIESMACGTPVIAYDRGALGELVRNNETGYIVNDLPSMLKAIEKRSEIRPENCRKRYEENFSSGIMAKKYIELYKWIINK